MLPASIPGSKFGRHGGSEFNRRRHTDYDGMSFYATQVFFPKTAAWDNLQKSLKAEFDPSVWEHLAGTVSEPFAVGPKQRVAVKVIDERGNELMRVLQVA
mgnify:CR=1 FL=1